MALLSFLDHYTPGALLGLVVACLAVTSSLLALTPSKQGGKRIWIDIQAFFTGPAGRIRSRIRAWAFLIHGPTIVQDAYNRAHGAPFPVDVPENRYIIVSSWNHIREIDAAPDNVLSLQAAAKEMIQPKHTMADFDWVPKRGSDGIPLIKTLKVLLTNHHPQLLPEIRSSMARLLDSQHGSAGPGIVKTLPLYRLMLGGIVYSNALSFFGKDVASNEAFLRAGDVFVAQTLIQAEILRLLPKPLAGMTGKLLSKRFKSSKIVHDTLLPIATERLEEHERKLRGQSVPEHSDCIQWIIESAPKSRPWSAERIVHELMALWFASVHVTSTSLCFAIHDLCLRPEYIQPLRDEIDSVGWASFEQSGGTEFPLIESFLKESMRTMPVETVSTRRMALKPFHFSDGTTVQPGQWVCTALRGMMLDPTNYAAADEFHGFRFVDPELLRRKTTKNETAAFQTPESGKALAFTDTSEWQVWGTGKRTCPGRFYAAAVMKTMFALFVTKYDMKLTDPEASRYFTWRTLMYPYPSTTVDLTSRS